MLAGPPATWTYVERGMKLVASFACASDAHAYADALRSGGDLGVRVRDAADLTRCAGCGETEEIQPLRCRLCLEAYIGILGTSLKAIDAFRSSPANDPVIQARIAELAKSCNRTSVPDSKVMPPDPAEIVGANGGAPVLPANPKPARRRRTRGA